MKHENVIVASTLAEAIDDGVLQQLGWAQDKPLIGTADCAGCARAGAGRAVPGRSQVATRDRAGTGRGRPHGCGNRQQWRDGVGDWRRGRDHPVVPSDDEIGKERDDEED